MAIGNDCLPIDRNLKNSLLLQLKQVIVARILCNIRGLLAAVHPLLRWRITRRSNEMSQDLAVLKIPNANLPVVAAARNPLVFLVNRQRINPVAVAGEDAGSLLFVQ